VHRKHPSLVAKDIDVLQVHFPASLRIIILAGHLHVESSMFKIMGMGQIQFDEVQVKLFRQVH
jgi:hypothetical protein